jgi:hypothetical protein
MLALECIESVPEVMAANLVGEGIGDVFAERLLLRPQTPTNVGEDPSVDGHGDLLRLASHQQSYR